jgi:hypothetical protein
LGSRQGKLAAYTDPEYESRIPATLAGVGKDDLVTIAGALSLPRDGMVIDLTARIKEHLAANADCANQAISQGLRHFLGTASTTQVLLQVIRRICRQKFPLPLTSLGTCHHDMHLSSHTDLSIPASYPPYFFRTAWRTSRTTQSTHVSIPISTSIPSTIFYSESAMIPSENWL